MKKLPQNLTNKEKRQWLKPPGGGVGYYTGRDRQRLRYGLWAPEKCTSGTVLVLPGRGEFIEKYYETIADLLDRSFTVLILDWRGQGLSGRLLKDATKSYGDDFGLMVGDLIDILKLAKQKKLPRPWIVLGHSMGAHMFLRLLHDKPEYQKEFSKAVLCSPMLGINVKPLTASYIKRRIARAKSRKKLKNFAPFQSNKFKRWKTVLGLGRLTSDAKRFQVEQWLIDQNPALAIGGVTYGWLEAAYKSIDLLQKSNLPERLTLPVAFVLAGKETVVDPKATRAFIARMPNPTCVTLKAARHEILVERDEIRNTFWKIFDSFIAS